MECNGTTYVGHVEDDLGEIRYVFCDACRTILVDSWNARRKRRSWGITYLDPKTISRPPPPIQGLIQRFRERIARLLA